MILEVTISHAEEGTYTFEPEGWKDAVLGMDRADGIGDFHTLAEYFKSNFRAYGSNGVDDGLRDFLKQIENNWGFDALIKETVRIADYEGGPFEEFFVGQIPVFTFVESIDEQHTIAHAPSLDSVWAKLNTRFETPVNIQSSTSIEGVPVDIISPILMPLPPQAVPMKHFAPLNDSVILSEGWAGTGIPPGGRTVTTQFANRWLQVGFDPEIDEIEKVTNSITDFNSALPVGYIEPKFPGDYRIRCQVIGGIINGYGLTDGGGDYVYSYFISDINGSDDVIDFYYQKNNESPVLFPAKVNNIGLGLGGSNVSAFSLDVTLTLTEADVVRIYGKFSSESTKSSLSVDDGIGFVVYGKKTSGIDGSSLHGTTPDDHIFNLGTPDLDTPYSFIQIDAKTLYPETTAEVFLWHDLMRSVIDRITDQNDTLRSKFLGNLKTSPSYPEIGCASNNVGVRGLQLRGYSLAEKQFSISLKDIWEAVNSSYNASLGYEIVVGKMYIRVEEKGYAYDYSSAPVKLSNVRKITRSYDQDHIHNKYEVGFRQWESEDISGLDDPQASQVRANKIRNLQNGFEVLSPWIAASYAIETTRRTRAQQTADYKYDNETFLIAVVPDGESFKPERDENFTVVNGLKYPETRYNIRHSPAIIFTRWMEYFNGPFINYPGGMEYTFQSAKGNYDMETDFNGGDCDDFTQAITESEDIVASSSFYFLPELYEIEHYMSLQDYKTIRANKNKAIDISQTESGHIKCLIKDLEFTPATGLLTIRVWSRERINLQVIDNPETEHENIGRIFDRTFDKSFN